MRVKIGDKIYDSNDEPIMIMVDEEEKHLISISGCQGKFCSYPDNDNYTPEMIREFMNT